MQRPRFPSHMTGPVPRKVRNPAPLPCLALPDGFQNPGSRVPAFPSSRHREDPLSSTPTRWLESHTASQGRAGSRHTCPHLLTLSQGPRAAAPSPAEGCAFAHTACFSQDALAVPELLLRHTESASASVLLHLLHTSRGAKSASLAPYAHPTHADGCPNCQPAFVRRVKSSRQSSPLCHFSGLRGCPHYWDGRTPQPALPTSLGSSSAELCSPPCLQDVSALSRNFADPVTPGSPIPSTSTVQLPGLAGVSPPHPPSEAGHGVTQCT